MTLESCYSQRLFLFVFHFELVKYARVFIYFWQKSFYFVFHHDFKNRLKFFSLMAVVDFDRSLSCPETHRIQAHIQSHLSRDSHRKSRMSSH